MNSEHLTTLLQLLEAEGAEVYFEEEEGWDWMIRDRDMSSKMYFSTPEEAIADMVKHLIANELPVITGIESEYGRC